MHPFIPLDLDNSVELRALCEDLDLIPQHFCTPLMLKTWKDSIMANARDLDEVEKMISREYYNNLIVAMRKQRYNKKLDLDDERYLKLNF